MSRPEWRQLPLRAKISEKSNKEEIFPTSSKRCKICEHMGDVINVTFKCMKSTFQLHHFPCKYFFCALIVYKGFVTGREVAQWLRGLGGCSCRRPGFDSSTHSEAHNCLYNSSSSGPDTVFCLPPALGTQVVHRHWCRQNSHMYIYIYWKKSMFCHF